MRIIKKNESFGSSGFLAVLYFITFLQEYILMLSLIVGRKLYARNNYRFDPSFWIAIIMSLYFSALRNSASAWTTQSVMKTSRSRHTSIFGIQQTFQFRKKFELRRMAYAASSSGEEKKEAPRRKSKKFKVVEKIEQHHLDKLAKAFDELAKKDGFDSAKAFFASDETFEDEFDDEDFIIDEIEDDFEQGDSFPVSAKNSIGSSEEDNIDYSKFDLSDFTDDAGSTHLERQEEVFDDNMDDRIAAAMSEMKTGKFSVPQQLDDYAQRLSADDIGALGFSREMDIAEQRENNYKLVTDAMTCSACGADFQCTSESRPGYLPPEKFDLQVKLSKIEEMQRLQKKADSEDWTPEDEIEWLIQTSGKDTSENSQANIDIEFMAKEMELDLAKVLNKKVICKRCHGLQNFGKVDENLRPGWTKEPMISQQKFLELLRPLREKTAVIVALVDLFDFSGSVLPELDSIAGDNPVIIAANKADLLPSKMGTLRAENWVRRELEYLGVKSLANIGGSVRLVSCKTGMGVEKMLDKARQLAEDLDCDIYVIGSANAGKSTLINHILGSFRNPDREPRKRRAGNANARKGEITTSPLPGTTLRFIKVDLGDGRYLYDTPGLLVPGTFTQLLTAEELKMVVPTK